MSEREGATRQEPDPKTVEEAERGRDSERSPAPARTTENGSNTTERAEEAMTENRSNTTERAADAMSTADLASAGTERDRGAAERGPATEGETEPLFAKQDAEAFRGDWQSIQAGFVDEPRRAVEQADKLVAEVIQRLAKVFADERSGLEAQWAEAGDIETEDFRLALRRYRSFFDRLLSV